ncbi:hypothetical protein [Bacillus safensis]|uniref:hypothetical protein n=1 Tax=Bacillus safensis TaxID=561879 RepID=UPI000AC97E43|nr:hypothetical protein [Bacillus safensis]
MFTVRVGINEKQVRNALIKELKGKEENKKEQEANGATGLRHAKGLFIYAITC